MCYPWYGNVRELKNIIEFAVNITNNNIIAIRDLPRSILKEGTIERDELNIDRKTKELIISALKIFGYSTLGKKRAAKTLGVSIATLYRKMNEFNIS